jgi:hypothetical protein
VVAAVMGQPVDGVPPSGVMQLIKAAGRPLSLTLRPHPDDDPADTAVTPSPEGEAVAAGPLVVLSDLPLVHAHLRHHRFRVLPQLRE